MNPEISVVVPTYRRPNFLAKALDSVEVAAAKVPLDRSALEIIVVDDGHCDDTQALCERALQSRPYPVTYMRTSIGPSAGPGTARNQGAFAARGKYIFFLDDDDQFLPNRFHRCLELLRSGAYDGVLEKTIRVPIDGSGRQSYVTGPADNITVEPFIYLFNGGEESHITPGATSFTKDIFVELGGIDERLRHMGEDGEFLSRLCARGRVALLSGEPVALTTIHGDSISRPDRRRYWYNIKNLNYMMRNLKKMGCHDKLPFVRMFTSAKLDFILSQLRFDEPNYFKRIASGALALFYFPLECLSWKNVKTIGVFLFRSRSH